MVVKKEGFVLSKIIKIRVPTRKQTEKLVKETDKSFRKCFYWLLKKNFDRYGKSR